MKNKYLILAGLIVATSVSSLQALPTLSPGSSIGIVAANNVQITVNTTLNTVAFSFNTANASVNQVSGDFAGLLNQSANYVNFTYSPLSVVNPIWALGSGDASFDLLSITSILEGSGVLLNGTGVIHLNGFADTAGTWSFSADASSATFNFSSTATSVPDGGMTVMLLGAGLSSLAFIRRKLVA